MTYENNFNLCCHDRGRTADCDAHGDAHGIAGNRYFDGTLSFDDPAVADEAILPYYAQLDFPAQGSNTSENRLNWAFARLLTPTLAFTADGGWLHQNWPVGHTSGADKADIGLKYEAYRDNQHEALISVGLAWGIGHSGARGVGADAPDTIQPGLAAWKSRRKIRADNVVQLLFDPHQGLM